MAADPAPLRPGHGPLRWMGHLRAVEAPDAGYEPPRPVWTGPPVKVSDAEWAAWERQRQYAIALARKEQDGQVRAERRQIDRKRLQEETVAALLHRVHEQDTHIEALSSTVEHLTTRVQNLAELAKQLLELHRD